MNVGRMIDRAMEIKRGRSSMGRTLTPEPGTGINGGQEAYIDNLRDMPWAQGMSDEQLGNLVASVQSKFSDTLTNNPEFAADYQDALNSPFVMDSQRMTNPNYSSRDSLPMTGQNPFAAKAAQLGFSDFAGMGGQPAPVKPPGGGVAPNMGGPNNMVTMPGQENIYKASPGLSKQRAQAAALRGGMSDG